VSTCLIRVSTEAYNFCLRYDLYSKDEKAPNVEELKPYYLGLIAKVRNELRSSKALYLTRETVLSGEGRLLGCLPQR
jgi:hypothetical protein